MIKGTTSSGFKYEIDENILSDWRVVKKLSQLTKLEGESNDDAMAFILIMSDIEEIIFKDKGEAFEKHILKNNNGIVAPTVALSELFEILKSNSKTKN